ncbi:helix-turn-helix transcriptional regulator [Streptomyces sediminimaris]|uniref:helix-turn-helix transcriptional regulator n=1 Tax=Streptomyces sediminimaris TaxID=3383721 RepID=UPI00399B2C9D
MRGGRARPLERDPELRALERALGSAAERQGGFAVITGAPGCGRSALLDALCAGPAVAGFTVLRAACSAAEQGFAFGVVQQLFQPLLGARSAARVDALFTGSAAVSRTVLVDDPWFEGHTTDESVLHALHALLLRLSSERAVLLVVDDVQWADTASLTWLVYLAKRLSKARVLVLCAVTSQPADDDTAADPADDPAERGALRELLDAAGVVLEPSPLSAAAVRHMLGSAATDDLVRVCCEITGGRPAAVAAVASAVHALSPAPGDPADLRDHCQRSLLGWRQAGLASAPAKARRLADALAVLGGHADAHILRELAQLDEIEYAAALRALHGLGLLADTAPVRFVHPSLPAALYAAMPRGDRERLHGAAARLLYAAGQPDEIVVEHLPPAGRPLDRWAVGVLRSAAVRAAESGAAGRAFQLLRTAMVHGPADRQLRAQLLTELAAAERDTDPLSCVERVRTALPHLEPGPERVGAALLLPPILAASMPPVLATSVPPVGDLIRRVRDELAASDRAVLHRGPGLRLEARVRALTLFGDVGPLQARPSPPPSAAADEPGAARPGERVRELLRSGSADTGPGRELLAVLAWEAVLTGELPAADVAALCDRVVQGEPADPTHVHTSLPLLVAAAVAADAADSVDAVGRWVERAVAAARPDGSAGVRACLAAEQVVVLAGHGRLERARKLGLDLLETTGPEWPATRILTVSALVSVALQTQDVGLARRLLNRPLLLGDRRTRAAYQLLRGMLSAASGDLAGALDTFLGAGRDLARTGWTDTGCLPWRVWAAMVCVRLDERDRALELAEDELRDARAWGGPNPLGRALRLLGMLTPGEAGLGLLREAVDVHRRSANRLELARSATVLGRALRTAGLPGAEQLLATGERIARDCDASWLEGTSDSELVGPVPRLLRAGRDRLSRAEGAVVDLVQRGLNNARIAEELNVTRRAVEKHLTNVYRKLGVTGRAALISELAPAAPNLEPQGGPH